MIFLHRKERLLVDDDWYLEQYPDVKASGMDPYQHFMRFGVKEGRNPNAFFDTKWYLNEYLDVARAGKNPLSHYLKYGVREERDPSASFCTRAYLDTYPDVAAADTNPLVHYLKFGRYEGRTAITKLGVTNYQAWVEVNDTLSERDIDHIRVHIQRLKLHPLISVVVPVYNTKETYLRELVKSLRDQLYTNWELCFADDASSAPHIQPLLEEFSQVDTRIQYVLRPENGHICAATNSALDLATGEFVALVDHDDILPIHALYEIAVEINKHPDVDLIYTDQDVIDAGGKRLGAYFKNDWNLDLLHGQNMINHLGVYRRRLIDAVGRMRLGFEGSQDYDLALRVADASSPDKIRHIPTILYHWRMDKDAGNFSRSQRDKCVASAKQAVEDHFARRNERVRIVPARFNPSYMRVIRELPPVKPLVSILIPTRDRADLLKQCIKGLLKRTDYDRIEIIIIDNESVEPKTLKLFQELQRDPRIQILPFAGLFNYSAINNAAAQRARGEILLLLNNDIDVIHPEWLTEMVSHVLRPEVGAVGAKLYYADNKLQHGGVVLGFGGSAGHYFPSAAREAGGYYSDLHLTRRVSCVTGACLAIRRDVFMAIGGLDAENLKIAYNDVDLCIRLSEAGYHIIWTPYAELYHYESASRGSDQTPDKIERFKREQNYLKSRWPKQLENDPFYNPNLSLTSGYAMPAIKTRRKKPWLDEIEA